MSNGQNLIQSTYIPRVGVGEFQFRRLERKPSTLSSLKNLSSTSGEPEFVAQ
jgi:hypothetical protein